MTGQGEGAARKEGREGTICALLQGHVKSEKGDLQREETMRGEKGGSSDDRGGNKRDCGALKRPKEREIKSGTARYRAGGVRSWELRDRKVRAWRQMERDAPLRPVQTLSEPHESLD